MPQIFTTLFATWLTPLQPAKICLNFHQADALSSSKPCLYLETSEAENYCLTNPDSLTVSELELSLRFAKNYRNVA